MSSLGAIMLATLALLPGVLFTSTFEARVGAWRIGVSDRLLRFAGFSAVFHLVLGPLSYHFWGRFGSSGHFSTGRALPWYFWAFAGAFVIFPLFLGALVGNSTRSGKRWAELVTGRDPAPRAWDHLFSSEPEGWMRLRLKSGAWVAGAFGRADKRKSYASGYPEEGDIYLSQTIEIDPTNGEINFDEAGNPNILNSSLLVRWDEVEYLELEDISGQNRN